VEEPIKFHSQEHIVIMRLVMSKRSTLESKDAHTLCNYLKNKQIEGPSFLYCSNKLREYSQFLLAGW
jgi:hypothetical protein